MDPVEIINSGMEQILGAAAEYAPTLLTVAVVLAVSFIVIKIIKALIRRALTKVDFNEDIEYLVYRAAGWAMWFLVITWLIGSLGMEAVFASLLGFIRGFSKRNTYFRGQAF